MKNIRLLNPGRFGNLIIDSCYIIYNELYQNKEDHLNILLENDHTHESTLNSLNMLFNNQYIKFYNSEEELLKENYLSTCEFQDIKPYWDKYTEEDIPKIVDNIDDKIDVLLKYINDDQIQNKYLDIYKKFKNSLTIHLRLTDYIENGYKGYQILNTNYINKAIQYCQTNFNFNQSIYVISDDIDKAKFYLKSISNNYNFKFHTYNDFFMDWLSLYFSKYIIGSASTFSLTSSILGHTKNALIPYPYYSLKYFNNTSEHECLYYPSKIIKTNLKSNDLLFRNPDNDSKT